MQDDDETPSDHRAPYSPEPAPDAGASLLGRFGLGNEMICWLLGRGQGDVLQMTPLDMARALPRPRCPYSLGEPHRMVPRPGEWACYQHDSPVKVPIPPFWPVVETGDVLGRAGDALDLVYEEGRWRVREL